MELAIRIFLAAWLSCSLAQMGLAHKSTGKCKCWCDCDGHLGYGKSEYDVNGYDWMKMLRDQYYGRKYDEDDKDDGKVRSDGEAATKPTIGRGDSDVYESKGSGKDRGKDGADFADDGSGDRNSGGTFSGNENSWKPESDSSNGPIPYPEHKNVECDVQRHRNPFRKYFDSHRGNRYHENRDRGLYDPCRCYGSNANPSDYVVDYVKNNYGTDDSSESRDSSNYRTGNYPERNEPCGNNKPNENRDETLPFPSPRDDLIRYPPLECGYFVPCCFW